MILELSIQALFKSKLSTAVHIGNKRRQNEDYVQTWDLIKFANAYKQSVKLYIGTRTKTFPLI